VLWNCSSKRIDLPTAGAPETTGMLQVWFSNIEHYSMTGRKSDPSCFIEPETEGKASACLRRWDCGQIV
jgi:hypothetical protein